MRDARLLLLSLALALTACGGGSGGGGTAVVIAPPSPPPPVQLRGVAIGGATLVPVTVSGNVKVNTLDPAVLKALVDTSVVLGSNFTGTPTCAITTYTLKYHTIDSKGADTDASTAIMVPSGGDAACRGGRPVLLYAHGTSVQKSYDMADLSSSEPRLVAAMFAAQGYIVVAPNYAGYAGSSLGYHAYLDATQQAGDMIDALRAARGAFAGIGAAASGRLMVTGYSQGGFVAMATQRAMQTQYPSEFNVTASAPLSGPYALLQFGDGIFNGAPTVGSSGFMPMLFTAAQRAGATIYTNTGDVYEAKYATGIETLLPGTQGLGALVEAGKLPNDVLFAQDSLPQSPGYASFFGPDHLLKTSFRDSYLADLKANPCSAGPANCAPAQPLRKWLLKNDLRAYTPAVPTFLCGGNADPLVPFNNTSAVSAYFRAQGMSASQLTVLDVEDDSVAGPFRTTRVEFAAAKALLRRITLEQGGTPASADQAVKDSYHAGLVAPFCLREARIFLDSAPAR